MMTPDHRYLTDRRMRIWLASESAALRLEAIRTLAMQSNPKRVKLLAEVAQDDSQSDEVERKRSLGYRLISRRIALCWKRGNERHPTLRREAERTLRLASGRPAAAKLNRQPRILLDWKVALAEQGDAAAGRRLFFSPVGPRCSTCHKYGGPRWQYRSRPD